jgi:hypothetical protein
MHYINDTREWKDTKNVFPELKSLKHSPILQNSSERVVNQMSERKIGQFNSLLR